MPQPRGRGPSTRGVFAIEDQALLLPDPIALDTSFVVEALIETQPLHRACEGFAARILDAGVSVVTSELLDVELAEAAFAIALKARWGATWRRHRTDGRARRPSRRLLAGVSVRYEALLSSLDHIPVPIRQVSGKIPELMGDCGLASYDAVHAASAIAAGAEAIVTTDTGFALLPTSLLAIYTDRARLASCRDKRPR
jgi:predicted nucleic acid-binding protein